MKTLHADSMINPQPAESRDSQQFAQFYGSLRPRLLAALRMSGAGDYAEDIAQDAFAGTLAHWEHLDPERDPSGYLFVSAFRLLRRQRNSVVRIHPPAVSGRHEPAGEDMSLTAIIVRETVERMPLRRRECVALALYLGYPVNETAEVLGVAAATVRVHIFQARRELARALRGSDPS